MGSPPVGIDAAVTTQREARTPYDTTSNRPAKRDDGGRDSGVVWVHRSPAPGTDLDVLDHRRVLRYRDGPRPCACQARTRRGLRRPRAAPAAHAGAPRAGPTTT